MDYNPLDPFADDIFSANTIGIYKGEFIMDCQLVIKKVKYSSPGSIDLVGFGKAFEVIKQVCFKYLPNRTDKLKNENLALQNLEKKIALLKQLGFTDLQLQSLLLKEQTALGQIENLIDTGKIVDIEPGRNN